MFNGRDAVVLFGCPTEFRNKALAHLALCTLFQRSTRQRQHPPKVSPLPFLGPSR